MCIKLTLRKTKFWFPGRNPLWEAVWWKTIRGQPLNTDASLLRTFFFIFGESPYIVSKFNPLLRQTLVFRPINRFSQKDNLANAEISMLIVFCQNTINRAFLFDSSLKKYLSKQHAPSSPSVHRIEWIVDANFRLVWHQTSYAENGFD